MTVKITLTYVTDHLKPAGKKTHYKTLKGAQKAALRLVGSNPRVDPDGYAVARNGNCLFVSGATLAEVCPTRTRKALDRLAASQLLKPSK